MMIPISIFDKYGHGMRLSSCSFCLFPVCIYKAMLLSYFWLPMQTQALDNHPGLFPFILSIAELSIVPKFKLKNGC
jgi:hypothetical protein